MAEAEPAGAEAATDELNQSKWDLRTQDNMMKASFAVRDMLSRIRQNELEEATNKAAKEEFAKLQALEAKNKVVQKAEVHLRVIDTSFECMQAIDDNKLQMEDCNVKLKHTRMQGFAALQVCERRLSLREKRPKDEMFHDSVNESLLNEKKKLESHRKELLKMEEEAKGLVKKLTMMRQNLSVDMGARRLEMAKDFSSLKMHIAPPSPKRTQATAPAEAGDAASGEKEEAAPPPAAASPAKKMPAAAEKPAEAAAPAAPAAAEEQEAGAVNAADADAVKETNAVLKDCAEVKSKTIALIARAKQEAKEALVKVEDHLQRRCADLAKKKKDLEMHALDVEAAMNAADRALDRMKKRLDPKDHKKKERYLKDVEASEKLRQARKQLQDDIRNKFTALEIDNLCRRVTPAKADSAKRQSQQQTMARTASAPSLRKKAGAETAGDFDSLDELSTRASTGKTASVMGGTIKGGLGGTGGRMEDSSGKPSSPAGISSTLKAAGAATGLA